MMHHDTFRVGKQQPGGLYYVIGACNDGEQSLIKPVRNRSLRTSGCIDCSSNWGTSILTELKLVLHGMETLCVLVVTETRTNPDFAQHTLSTIRGKLFEFRIIGARVMNTWNYKTQAVATWQVAQYVFEAISPSTR